MKENEKAAGWKAAAWAMLRNKDISKKAKLAFYKELLSLDVLPEEASFFLIQWEILSDAEDRLGNNREYMKIVCEMWDIEERNNQAEGWPAGKGPKRYRILTRKSDGLRDKWMELAFRRAGEREMAVLYLSDRKKFNKLVDAGHEYFYLEFDYKSSNKATMERMRSFGYKYPKKAA